MRPMLSIDFGNTYTKLGVRKNGDSRAMLLTDGSLKWDDGLFACVPTLAACHKTARNEKWYFGTDVMRFREQTPGLAIYRNWKPRFFDGVSENRRPPSPVSRPLRVGSSLPAPPGISDGAWQTILTSLPQAQVQEIWASLAGQSATPQLQAESNSEETDLDFKWIGLGFFRWLLAFIDPICRKAIGVSARDVPVRISLPSFGSVAQAELLLKEILSEAGWTLDDRVATLPEPLSNAIGTFTEGLNVTHRQGASPHYGRMFANTGLLARMREATLANGPRTAWVLIADVGGYTTDFAMVGLDLEDIDARLEGLVDGRRRLAHQSEALGVTNLDQQLRDRLAPVKRQALMEIMNDPDQQRLETFHRNCFGRTGRYATRRAIIGDTRAERQMIQELVTTFAEQIADDAERFLETHQYDHIDDLILTGGGTMITAVREALCSRLQRYGLVTVHFGAEPPERQFAGIRSHTLMSQLVRGATAIGGASIYFDFANAT